MSGRRPGSTADFRYIGFDFPGASATNPGGINARGDIVGNYHDANGHTHGFLLRQGVFSTIDFPNASFTAARAINARGDIVGRVLGPSGDEHGFLLRDGISRRLITRERAGPQPAALTTLATLPVGTLTVQEMKAASS